MEDRETAEMDDKLHALNDPSDLLKDPDYMILSDDERSHVYNPPAHLAARFHRAGANRRRSSAASSRRNSLASSHSQHSSRSKRLAHQNNCVAQHLRRASIIENRKARLADKAAHAEQVRLRAALAKAAPRASNSEEKALAAKLAREKLLAKVAASCAEEVARAKKVAEENRERKAAEERRSRLEMEEKHAEAERRRLEYKKGLRKPRTTSIPSGEGKRCLDSRGAGLNGETAARRIQRTWRQWRRRKTVEEFLGLDLTIDRVRSINFMEASTLLADRRVITSGRKTMNMLQLDAGQDIDETLVRRFISAFMILGHATEIFNTHGHQEEDLIEKAKELLISFENTLSAMSSSSLCAAPSTHLETLAQAHATYLTAFSAWKTNDASVLIGTMIDQFVAFDDIWQTVKDDTRGEVANDYREAIRDQQVILLSKIKKLAGPDQANDRIKAAIRESRRARMRRRPIGDVRPRPVGARESPSGTQSNGDVSSAAATEQIQAGSDGVQQGVELSELSRIFSNVPPNRALVHELMIDPGFRIEVSPHSDVRSALNREVCESMRRAVEQGQGDFWTVAVAENIRSRLSKLLKPGNTTHRLLEEVLDAEHVRAQCAQGLFSYENFFAFMADLLPRLCAPFRDEEVRILAAVLQRTGDGVEIMIKKLFRLLHMIDLMSLDYTNYMLQQAAPTLIREAPGYENRMFAQDLESGALSLQKTKRWWRHASVNIVTDSGVNGLPRRPTFSQVYARALVDLCFGTTTLQDTDVPETLSLDTVRFARIRADMLRFVTVGAVLLTAKSLLKRDVRSQWKPEAKRILDSLRDHGFDNADGNLSARILAIVESSKGMPQSSKDHLASVIARFLDEMRTGRLADPVLKLLLQRLKMHVFHRLAAENSVDRVRVASTASEGLAGIGLSEFVGQIGAVADELTKVKGVDLGSHGDWYRLISDELDRMGAAEA